jgi:hypothetical protein
MGVRVIGVGVSAMRRSRVHCHVSSRTAHLARR